MIFKSVLYGFRPGNSVALHLFSANSPVPKRFNGKAPGETSGTALVSVMAATEDAVMCELKKIARSRGLEISNTYSQRQ